MAVKVASSILHLLQINSPSSSPLLSIQYVPLLRSTLFLLPTYSLYSFYYHYLLRKMKYSEILPYTPLLVSKVAAKISLGIGSVTGCQLLALLLAGTALADTNHRDMVRRNPAPPTLAECLTKEVPGFSTGTKVSIQALRNCMGQVQKREATDAEEADVDVTSYIIDGGKPNVRVT